MSLVHLHALSRNISNISQHPHAKVPAANVRQQKVVRTRGWQAAKNYAFRPFAHEQQFAAIYDIHGVEAYSSEGRSAGLAETRHRTPPRWIWRPPPPPPPLRRIAFTLDSSIEGVARTGGRSFTSPRLTRNLSGCHPDVPSVGFPRRGKS